MARSPFPAAISGILLIAGTCIGAGMLALPIVAAPAGFYPSMMVNILTWLFMMATGLLFFEVTLWMPEGANVLSMAKRFLGSSGQFIGGVSFVFLYYCLMVSYISGGAPLFEAAVIHALGVFINPSWIFWGFVAAFMLLVFLGTRVVDRVNWLLMGGLILSYVLLIAIGSREVQNILLQRQNWGLSLMAAPTFFSAYGYHNVIPSLSFYLKEQRHVLRWAIVVGTAIPFVIYSLWQWLIIGAIPYDILELAADQGVPVSQTLEAVTGHRAIPVLITYFGLFALVTSLMGVALSMVDFLGDAFSMQRVGWNRLMLCGLVFLPPAVFALKNPGVFLEAIGIAGGFGEAILNGLLPILMVWVGRYIFQLKREDQLPGGKTFLGILFVFTLFIMGLEAYHLFFRGPVSIAE